MPGDAADLPAWRRALRPLATIYGSILRRRNQRYDADPTRTARAGVPVISVGNFTVGGTGKTPTVIEAARLLVSLGRRPAILTRGYRARRNHTPDEVAEFHAALPDVPVVVDPDRVAGAARACGEFTADVLVLDDGFQHRRLARDLDLVLVDALDPWGGGCVLPAGRLREPLEPACARAGAFLITRVNQAPAERAAEIRARLTAMNSDAPLLAARIEPAECVGMSGPRPMADLAYQNVLPVCAIGNPQTFLRLVGELAGRCCRPLLYRDHHHYTTHDARHIIRAADAQHADLVLTTRKDWSKLAPLWPTHGSTPPLARLDVRMVLDRQDTFRSLIESVLARA